MDILDLTAFMDNGIITETSFFNKAESFNWEQYRDRSVLVKGCGTTIIPPWAFMTVAARLAQVARRVLYGNEHTSVSIFSRSTPEAAHAD